MLYITRLYGSCLLQQYFTIFMLQKFPVCAERDEQKKEGKTDRRTGKTDRRTGVMTDENKTFAIEQAMKTQNGSRSIVLLFL